MTCARLTMFCGMVIALISCAPRRTPPGGPPATDSAARQRALDSAFEAIVLADLRRPFPTDSELAERFNRHRDLFNQLLAMARADSELVRIAPDFTWTRSSVAWPRPKSEVGFTDDRWNQYRSLFDVLGLEAGLLQRPQDLPKVIYFMVQTKGLVTSGSVKGYAYAEAQLKPQCESLDRDRGASRYGICFRPLTDGWYLYLEWD